MASACVNNNAVVGVTKFSSFAWLSPPRLSFTRDRDRDDVASSKTKPNAVIAEAKSDLDDDCDDDASDFQFCLDDPDASVMLPADELFSDGKLIPTTTMTTTTTATFPPLPKQPEEIVVIQTSRRITEILNGVGGGGADTTVFSPRAPRCASRWKEIFGLKKLQHNSTTATTTTEAKITSANNNNKSLKNFLHRKSKSDAATGLNLPLMRDIDYESLSVSSRLSLSSSSSGHELEDFPRFSVDSEKHKNNINPISLLKSVANPNNHQNPPPRVRLNAGTRIGKSPMRRTASAAATEPTVTYADSPRMHPSGKIVFHSLERSSSSPGSFNGGPRFKHSISGMERSYSANVRVAPVLNVPVCSLSKSGNVLGGFGRQLFSNSNSNGGSSGSTSSSKSYQSINNSNIRRK